jgi:hypothetical protein
MGLGRADPVDGVPAAGEEHRDRQPRRPRGFKHHLQPSSRRRPLKSGLLGLGQAVHGRHGLAAAYHAAVASQHPHRVLADYPQVDPDQPPLVHRCLLAVVVCPPAAPRATLHDHGPKATAPLPAPTTAPTHVLQPAPAATGRATSLIRGIRGRPRVAIRATGHGALGAVPRAVLDATPGTNREAYATLRPRYGSSTGVPYMSSKDRLKRQSANDPVLPLPHDTPARRHAAWTPPQRARQGR